MLLSVRTATLALITTHCAPLDFLGSLFVRSRSDVVPVGPRSMDHAQHCSVVHKHKTL